MRAMPTTSWDDDRLNAMRYVGDQRADDTVASIFEHGSAVAVNELLASILRDDQLVPAALPDDVERYFADTGVLPAWHEPDRIARAQEFFGEHGVQIMLALLCASLPSSYAAARGVQVLALTGRLGSHPARRVLETGQFLMDVMAPGGLGTDGTGIRTIQRVRLMHAAVRWLILDHAQRGLIEWDDDWGHPLNQEDLAGTLMAFAFVVDDVLPRLGVDISAQEADDYLHTWGVIGAMLGVLPDMIPRTMGDARALVAAIERRQFAPSDAGRLLTDALVDLLERTAPDHHLRHLGPATIRYLIGERTASLIGLDAAPDPAHVRKLVSVLFGFEEAMEHNELLRLVAPKLARTLLRGFFFVERGGNRSPFAIPTSLATRWDVPAG